MLDSTALAAVGVLAAAGGVLVGAFLVVYGVKAGLVNRRIIRNSALQTYATGREAVQRGLFYIVAGLVLVSVLGLALIGLVLRQR